MALSNKIRSLEPIQRWLSQLSTTSLKSDSVNAAFKVRSRPQYRTGSPAVRKTPAFGGQYSIQLSYGRVGGVILSNPGANASHPWR